MINNNKIYSFYYCSIFWCGFLLFPRFPCFPFFREFLYFQTKLLVYGIVCKKRETGKPDQEKGNQTKKGKPDQEPVRAMFIFLNVVLQSPSSLFLKALKTQIHFGRPRILLFSL